MGRSRISTIVSVSTILNTRAVFCFGTPVQILRLGVKNNSFLFGIWYAVIWRQIIVRIIFAVLLKVKTGLQHVFYWLYTCQHQPKLPLPKQLSFTRINLAGQPCGAALAFCCAALQQHTLHNTVFGMRVEERNSLFFCAIFLLRMPGLNSHLQT